MKNTIVTTLLLSVPAFAGTPAVISAAPALPEAPAPITLEVAGIYKNAAKETAKLGPAKNIDVFGMDLTLVKPVCPNSAFTLRFGYNFGDEANRFLYCTEEIDVHSFYLMPGYRYTHALTDKVSVYGGINAGIGNTSIKAKYDDAYGDFAKAHDSSWGFVASIEAGVRYQLNEKTDVFAAYEYSVNYADTMISDDQTYNSLRVGMGIKF